MLTANLITELKRSNPDLKMKEIEGILYLLLNEQDLDNNSLLRLTGLPRETIKNFKKSLGAMLQNPVNDNVKLASQACTELKQLGLEPYSWSLKSYSDETLESWLANVRLRQQLYPKRDLDQFFATVNTSVAKALIIRDLGLFSGKKIALIGDDDLVSLVLGKLSDTSTEICVFEIDTAITGLIEQEKKLLPGTNIQIIKYDARTELSKKYLGYFDVVLTDPPYTKQGVKLFVNRAIQLLGNLNSYEGKYIFLYYGNSFKTPEKTLKIQELLSDFNLVIEDKIDKFSRYYGAESIGSASSLYILKTSPFTQEVTWNLRTPIYTYEDQKEEKFPFVDHYVFKLFNVPAPLLMSKSKLLTSTEEFCKQHKLKVVEKIVTDFKNGGMSITFVLATSNLLIHTWPEFNALHIDLITCAPIFNKQVFFTTLKKVFLTDSIELTKVE